MNSLLDRNRFALYLTKDENFYAEVLVIHEI